MSNIVLHPGLILIAAGILAVLLPIAIKKYIAVLGALCSLVALISLRSGDVLTVPFINDIELYLVQVDKLNWIFGLVFTIVALTGGIYSMHNNSRMETLCSMCYAGAALGVVFAGDWLTLIIFWELMAASSLFLIWCNNTDRSRKAGFRYLMVHMAGGNLLLAGIFLKVSGGEMAITNLTNTGDAAFWLIFLGVAINAAIPPLHGWLPDAYPEGTITGSIFLSSYTTKVAVYCLIRIFAGTEWLVWVGVIMALYGVFFAIIENDARKLLAYHIISQVGFMICGVGIGTEMAINGASAHAFSHVIYKSLLFMGIGAIMYSTGIRKINQLGGLAKKMPFLCVCFAIFAFSIAGVPGFNGFISKSITITAAMEEGYYQAELLLSLASAGTFLSIPLKMLYFIFIREPKEEIECKPIPKNMYVAIGAGAVLCVGYGLFPDLLYRFLPYEMEYHPFTVDHIVQYVQIFGMAMLPFMMYLKNMEPHSQLSLDTDWLYRKPLVALVRAISGFCCAVREAMGFLWRFFYDAYGPIAANPLRIIGVTKTTGTDGNSTDKYDADSYRPAIGEVMMLIMTVLLVGILIINF